MGKTAALAFVVLIAFQSSADAQERAHQTAAPATLLSQPQRLNFDKWISPDDMPAVVQMTGVSRRVITRINVGPDGAIRSCEVAIASGDDALDRHTCKLVMERGKYTPAKWIDGSATYGIDRVTYNWAVEFPAPPRSDVGDLSLTVPALPKGVRSPAGIAVAVAVDESGKPIACNNPRFAGRDPLFDVRNAELVSTACMEVMQSFTAQPLKDADGRNVPSVQLMSVRLTQAHDGSGQTHGLKSPTGN